MRYQRLARYTLHYGDARFGHLTRICGPDCHCDGRPRYGDSEEAGVELDRRARRYVVDHPHLSYRQAVDRQLEEDTELRAAYVGEPARPRVIGLEVRRVTLSRMRRTGENYAAAMRAVLREDPDLARRYAAGEA